MYTVTEGAIMEYAYKVVVADCAARFGFNYPIEPYSDVLATSRSAAVEMLSRRFGVSDRTLAERYGYGLAPSPPLSAEEAAVAEDASFMAVLDGTAEASAQVPEGGCTGEANRRLDGVLELNSGDHARELWVQAGFDVMSEPEYQEAVAQWSTCMAEAGYETDSPLSDPAVVDLINGRQDPEIPSQEEIARALVDVECKLRTKLVERLSAVAWSFEESVVEANLLVLQENRQQLERRLDLAIAEIEKSGGLR